MSQSQPQNFWIETSWHLPKKGTETLSILLEQFGSLGSYEKMGLLAEDEELRTEADLIAYFPDTPDLTALTKKLSVLETGETSLKHCIRIPQAEWATEWKKYFKPFTLTASIVIRPSWEDYVAKPGETVVTLDPGMAFGTGQHDTTRFCAELLSSLKSTHPQLNSLIDVGCGSGILSIIAKKIGYGSVTGIDNDPAAIETAEENLARNPDAERIAFHRTDGALQAPYLAASDVVVANIIAEALCDLKPDLSALVAPGGFLVLSGILPQREDMVKTAFVELSLVDERKSPDWHAYVYRRQ
jgi:ribosomal protein L11 methyltransferase